MKRKKTLVCVAKLHKNQLERHLELFEHIRDIERVIVVRHQPLSGRLSKLENRDFGGSSRLAQACRLAVEVRRTVRETQAEWVIGFNPVPWGSIGSWASAGLPRKVCLSLIGMDFLQVQKNWGRPFLDTVRRADAITVTGSRMQDRLVSLGVSPERIHVLPHSVDLQRFRPSESRGRWDVVSVGQLIHRKRMDVLIDAAAQLRLEFPGLRVGILGEGPLRKELLEQVRERDLAENVEFLGFRDDVETVLSEARVFCLASEWEGVPFALMEAMASGLVPIVTDVGTIGDWIEDGRNGRVVPVGDSRALASALRELLVNRGALLEALRAKVLAERERLGFSAGAAAWRKILALSE